MCGTEEAGKACGGCTQFFCSQCIKKGYLLGQDCDCSADKDHKSAKKELAYAYSPGIEYTGEK